MKNPSKILLATDHSDAATNAARYAAELARKTNAVLIFLHIYEIPLSYPVGANDYARATEQLRNMELQRLERHRYEVLRSLHVSEEEVLSECIVHTGNIARQIKKTADHVKADLIIMGTHGMSAVREVFYGSHTWDVIKHTNVPVLAVPPNAVFAALERIVFATEYREGEKPPIQYLSRMAAAFDAEVTLLHVTSHLFSDEQEQTLMTKFVKEVKQTVDYPKLNIRLEHYEDVQSGLDDFCRQSNAQLLAMSPERQLFLEKVLMPRMSMTRQVCLHTHIPVLAIPDYYDPRYAEFWRSLANYAG